ncbi:MAG: SH3 domain-containing protein [Planktothrix sp.]
MRKILLYSAICLNFTNLFLTDQRAIASLTKGIAQLVPQEIKSNIAQNLPPLCQKVNVVNGLAVHLRPTSISPIVGNLSHQQQVNLAPNHRNIRGPEGNTWVEINTPLKGFVSRGFPYNETNLINCDGSGTLYPPNNPNPNNPNINNPPNSNLCRQINRQTAPRGLVVRANPSRSSTRLGAVSVGDQVYLAPSQQIYSDRNGENRQWIEITAPIPGFVAVDNLIRCR